MRELVKQYRKKPVVIEAAGPLTSANVLDIHRWCGAKQWDTDPAELRIKTLEGVMIASEGDYIIRGVTGEFYPCKPDIFAKTYDDVTADENTPAPSVATPDAKRSEAQLSDLIDALYEAKTECELAQDLRSGMARANTAAQQFHSAVKDLTDWIDNNATPDARRDAVVEVAIKWEQAAREFDEMETGALVYTEAERDARWRRDTLLNKLAKAVRALDATTPGE